MQARFGPLSTRRGKKSIHSLLVVAGLARFSMQAAHYTISCHHVSPPAYILPYRLSVVGVVAGLARFSMQAAHYTISCQHVSSPADLLP